MTCCVGVHNTTRVQHTLTTLVELSLGPRVFNLRTGADNQVDAIALMLQALAQGLALGAKAIHPPYFSQAMPLLVCVRARLYARVLLHCVVFFFFCDVLLCCTRPMH